VVVVGEYLRHVFSRDIGQNNKLVIVQTQPMLYEIVLKLQLESFTQTFRVARFDFD
jgi:hypothetical protein